MTLSKTFPKKVIRNFLVFGLKLGGWKLWIVLHILDYLWSVFVKPVLREKHLERKKMAKQIGLANFYRKLKYVENKDDFKEELKTLWKKRKDLGFTKDA